MHIQILPPELASQIAAGEVVERPASAVKELVENSLDAGAKTITVTIEEAGRRVIEVADDGCGIPAEEVPLAVERHATSKLYSAEQLFSIGTLGFRGEALASIGSVARLTLTSRTEDSGAATRISVEGGIPTAPQQVGAPRGTAIRVENLFYNVPARLKFLKKDVTERRRIDSLLTRYALAYPDVRFKLIQNGQAKLQTSGNGDRRAILATLYGVETAKQLLEVNAAEEGLRLSGFISPVAMTRSNRREITFFVNGRWVQDISLSTALIRAYHTMLMVGRYPLAALFLDLEPATVDVNVHPAKAEVRFRDPQRMFSFVQRSVRKAILAYTPVPQMGIAPPALWTERPSAQSGIDPAWKFSREAEYQGTGNQGLDASPFSTSNSQLPDSQPSIIKMPLLRLVGQIGQVYIIAEGPDGLYLIDQHAAHERILFERLLAQREANTLTSQNLLQAAIVHLPPQQATLLEEQLPILQKFGFEVESFGPNAFKIRAIPSIFSGSEPAAALKALVEDFEGDETPLQNKLEDRIAARVCKRMAVKGGQTLSTAEQESLLRDLENCDSPRTCPHGRPTMIHLSVELLERQFGRTGPR